MNQHLFPGCNKREESCSFLLPYTRRALVVNCLLVYLNNDIPSAELSQFYHSSHSVLRHFWRFIAMQYSNLFCANCLSIWSSEFKLILILLWSRLVASGDLEKL